MVGHFGTHLGTHFGHERESMKRGHSGILVWAGDNGRIPQVGNASIGHEWALSSAHMAYGMWHLYIYICKGIMESFCGGRLLVRLIGMRIEGNEMCIFEAYNICHLLYMKTLATVKES